MLAVQITLSLKVALCCGPFYVCPGGHLEHDGNYDVDVVVGIVDADKNKLYWDASFNTKKTNFDNRPNVSFMYVKQREEQILYIYISTDKKQQK
jgi:hypothetical protein